MQRLGRLRAGAALFACLTALSIHGEALARGEEGSWEFGAYGMYTRFPNESTIDEDVGFGVRGSYYFKALHTLELDLSRVSTDHVLIGGVEFDVDRIVVSYLHNYTPKASEKLSPFISVGLGRLMVEGSSMGTSAEDSSTLLRAGGGLRVLVSPRLLVRFDGRLSHWRGQGDAVPRDGYFTFDVTVGLSFVTKGGS